MAEFCLECFNKTFHKNYKEGEVTLETDLCEGCGEFKPCVISLYPDWSVKNILKKFLKKGK